MSSSEVETAAPDAREDAPLRNPWLWALLFGLVLFPALRPCSRRIAQPPPVLAELPELRLVDQQGRPVDRQALGGRIVLVSFLAASATDEGAALVTKLQRLQQGLQAAPEPGVMGLLTVSLDPATEDSTALTALASTLQADPSTWQFVAGAPADVAAASAAFLGTETPLGPDRWSPVLVLVDDLGRVRARIDLLADDDAVKEAYARAERVARERWEERIRPARR